MAKKVILKKKYSIFRLSQLERKSKDFGHVIITSKHNRIQRIGFCKNQFYSHGFTRI